MGEGRYEIVFDETPAGEWAGGAGPPIRSASDVRALLGLTVWPRLVELVEDCDRVLVDRAWQAGDDLAGSVRLRLVQTAGVRRELFGHVEVCVVGALPARWHGWRMDDGPAILGAYGTDLSAQLRAHRDDLPRAVSGLAGEPLLGWRELGSTVEPGPAGAERDALVDVAQQAMAQVERDAGTPLPTRALAGAAVDAMLADPVAGHVQCEGEADPDDVLVDIVDALHRVVSADPGALVQQALAVLHALEQDYTIHPRKGQE